MLKHHILNIKHLKPKIVNPEIKNGGGLAGDRGILPPLKNSYIFMFYVFK